MRKPHRVQNHHIYEKNGDGLMAVFARRANRNRTRLRCWPGEQDRSPRAEEQRHHTVDAPPIKTAKPHTLFPPCPVLEITTGSSDRTRSSLLPLTRTKINIPALLRGAPTNTKLRRDWGLVLTGLICSLWVGAMGRAWS